MVPYPVRPDDRHRAGGANLQAIGLGPLHPAAGYQPEFLQPPFEEFPRCLTRLAPTAFLFFGCGAQEDVPRYRLAADLGQGAASLIDFSLITLGLIDCGRGNSWWRR